MAVYKRSQDDPACKGMGTTIAALLNEPDGLHMCHVGDSRIYLLRDGHLRAVTRDHSLENLYADQPSLEGQLGPATSNVIVRALGLEPMIEVDHTVMQPKDKDLFVLCSDGLTDMVAKETLADIVQRDQPLETTVEELIDASNSAGGVDNVTVLLVRVLAE